MESKSGSHGGFEVTDLDRAHFKESELSVKIMVPGYAWLDTVHAASLLDAGNYVQIIEERRSLRIACLGTAHGV